MFSPLPAANLSLLRPGGTLPVTVAVGATTLYDLGKGWDGKGGIKGWRDFQKANAGNLPDPGPAFAIVKELCLLNRFSPDPFMNPLVRVNLVSRTGFSNSRRVVGAIKRDFSEDLVKTFSRSSYSGGKSILPHLLEMGADLYLARDPLRTYQALQAGISAVHILHSPDYEIKTNLLATPLFISWDGDGTVWDDESDKVFQEASIQGGYEYGVEMFDRHEEARVAQPSGPGPLFAAFVAFCSLRSVFLEFEASPFQQGLLTIRGLGSQERVHTTLAAYGGLGEYLDVMEGLAGGEKGPWLKLHGASLHLDDGESNIRSALDHGVLGGHVISRIDESPSS